MNLDPQEAGVQFLIYKKPVVRYGTLSEAAAITNTSMDKIVNAIRATGRFETPLYEINIVRRIK
jgi:hypothetical protein